MNTIWIGCFIARHRIPDEVLDAQSCFLYNPLNPNKALGSYNELIFNTLKILITDVSC